MSGVCGQFPLTSVIFGSDMSIWNAKAAPWCFAVEIDQLVITTGAGAGWRCAVK